MSKKSTQETFYELLMIICIDEDKRKRTLPALGDVFQNTFTNFEHIEYPVIYKMISLSTLKRVDVEIILEILVEVEKEVDKSFLKEMLNKMRRNFLLSYEQKESFNRLDKDFRANLQTYEGKLIEAQSELSNVQEQLHDAYEILNDINNDSSKIYAQFITILGIFTAIVVSVFGGLSIVSGVFDKLNDTPMWKIVLTGSLVSIFVLCLLFMLTRWTSTIVRKAFGHYTERSLMQIITNNGAFATGIFIFCYLIIASVIFSSTKVASKLKSLIGIMDALPILLILILPLLAGIFVFIKTINLRNK